MEITLEELKESSNEPDIICFTETFLKSGHETYVKLNNYEIATSFCRDKSRGGSCIFVKKDLVFTDLTFLKKHASQNLFEICGIEVPSIKSAIICVYRTPTTDPTLFLKKLEGVLLEMFKRNRFRGNVILLGDFNINTLKLNSITKNFQDLLGNFNLTNHINVPTRKKSCLDLIISNIDKATASVLPLHLSDHNTAQMLSFPIKCKDLKPAFHYVYVRDYSLENINKFQECLASLSWTNVYAETDFNHAFNEFHELFCLLYKLCFPKVKKRVNNINNRKQNWISNGLRISCKRKRYLRYQYYKNKSDKNKNDYKQYSEILQKCIHKSRKNANIKYINKSNNKCKATWTIINNEICNKNNLGTIDSIKIDNVIVTDPVDIANAMNENFIDSTKNKNKINNLHITENRQSNSIFLKPMTMTEVRNIVRSLRDTRSVGYDEISTKILKTCIDKIVAVITFLVNFSFESGTFPETLKLSIIKPLYKKGCKKCTENYRPITLISIWSKVFEKCMHDRLTNFTTKYNIINSEQYGFQKLKSTSLAIFSLIQHILNNINGDKMTTALFLDLSKAFDHISHGKLLDKMEAIGIRGPALSWIASYLTNRKQKVVIGKITKNKEHLFYSSDERHNSIGVPQGSVLGPTLFLLYINSISDVTNHKCILFADDITIIVTTDKNTNTIKDHETDINNTLNNIIQWLDINNLTINLNKTNYIQFNQSKHLQYNFNLNINSGHVTIKNATQTKFLGILIDQDLNWKTHVNDLCHRVNRFVYALKQVRKVTSISTALVSYHAYVESILRYGIIAWGNSTDLDRAFIAQKKCIRAIAGIQSDESCRPYFREFGLLPLPSLYIFEICTFVKKHFTLFKRACDINSRTRRDPDRLIMEIVPRSKKYSRNCVAMCINIYNKIPKSLKTLNISNFKNKLRDWLKCKNYYSVNEFLNDR